MSEKKKEKLERNCCGAGVWCSDGDATARALLIHARVHVCEHRKPMES